ncbi:MAG TPA: hypothetical protein VN682_14660 [Terriglobales bacterium]|nr:hypothetical protein [Terriglobales bacterium]
MTAAATHRRIEKPELKALGLRRSRVWPNRSIRPHEVLSRMDDAALALPSDSRKHRLKRRERRIVLRAILNCDDSGAGINIKTASIRSIRAEAKRLGLEVSESTIKRRMKDLRELKFLESLGPRWNGRATPRRRAVSLQVCPCASGAQIAQATRTGGAGEGTAVANLTHQTEFCSVNLTHCTSKASTVQKREENHPQKSRDDSPKGPVRDKSRVKPGARPRALEARPNPAAREVRALRQAIPEIETLFGVSRPTAEAFCFDVLERACNARTQIQDRRYFIISAYNMAAKLTRDESSRTDWEIETERCKHPEQWKQTTALERIAAKPKPERKPPFREEKLLSDAEVLSLIRTARAMFDRRE